MNPFCKKIQEIYRPLVTKINCNRLSISENFKSYWVLDKSHLYICAPNKLEDAYLQLKEFNKFLYWKHKSGVSHYISGDKLIKVINGCICCGESIIHTWLRSNYMGAPSLICEMCTIRVSGIPFDSDNLL